MDINSIMTNTNTIVTIIAIVVTIVVGTGAVTIYKLIKKSIQKRKHSLVIKNSTIYGDVVSGDKNVKL
jgi:hypothetical protein